MLQRPVSLALSVFLAGCAAASLVAQTAVPDANGRLVFQANARIVVLDVVATGRDGQPIRGLRKEDFSLAEDGHPQQIASFEEHAGGDATPAILAALPPNIFSNFPRVKPVDSVTVLLLDALNTPVEDQGFVRGQLLKYLQTARPGRRLAIFTLGTRLRFVQGFTDDPAALAAALGNSKNGATPRPSALITTNSESEADRQSVAVLYGNFAANPSSVNLQSLQSVQQFQAEQIAFKTDERVDLTLDALQQLARYLAGIPGRKNVIWFSGGYPLNLFPNPDLDDTFVAERKYERQVQRTDALLSAAEIALYPIAAEGVATDSLYSADRAFDGKLNMREAVQAAAEHPGQPQTQSLTEQAQGAEIDSLQKDSAQRNGAHTMMDLIAADTGGAAIYNTNGIDTAVARVLDHGSRYYTLTYTPTNAADDGRYRKVSVAVAQPKAAAVAKLAYRRGYFAVDPKGQDTDKAKRGAKSGDDPLHPFMGPGMPESTQILYALRVKGGPAPTTLDPTPEIQNHDAPVIGAYGRTQMVSHTDLVPGFENSEETHAGDNPRLKGKLTRYGIDFVIAASGLELDPAPDGSRRGSVESTLVAYDRDGKPLNWLVRQIDLAMDAAQYARILQNGVSFHLDIDVPKAAVTLRSGVYDLHSSLAGTFEVPLASVLVGQAPGLKAR